LDNDYTQIEFLKNVDDAKNIINTVFSNGYVRRYPFYILTILQNLQQGDTERLLFSSYGHYYEVLFRTAIKRLVISNDNIEAFFQFLPELANYYFRKRITSLTILDFEKFRSWYCKEYKISPAMKLIYDREALSNTLSEASMIKIEHDEVKFAAKSVYYFFLARYMADNLEKDIIKDQISNICKRIYRDDFANIILFIVHHTRNEFVINEILVNSKKYLAHLNLSILNLISRVLMF